MAVDREYHDDWKSGGTGQKMVRQFTHWANNLYVHDPEFDAAFDRLRECDAGRKDIPGSR